MKIPKKAETTAQAPALDDRISELPDEILHQILACPPYSIRDSMLVASLSKRWQNLWKSSPFLILDDSCYLENVVEDEVGADRESFVRFVDTFLLLRERFDVRSFCLSCWIHLHPDGQRHLYEWVQYAVRRNVRVIKLEFPSCDQDVIFPSCIFTCQSLEVLSLLFGRLFKFQIPKITLPSTVWLPQLRTLHLGHIEIDGAMMKKLILGCSGLEKLIFERCWIISGIILFNKLKDLTLERCCLGGAAFCVSCPRLQKFHFVQNFIAVWQVLLTDLTSLDRATVLIDHEEHKCEHEYSGKYCGNTIDFISGFSNAETLMIISSKVETLSEKQLSELPPFHNLKNLTLGGWRMSDKFQIVAHFIKQSPNLEMLTLINEEPQKKNEGEASKENEGESSHGSEGAASHENESEASQKIEQLWFHCPSTVIACRIQCGEETERLLDLVSKAILSTYTLPGHKVCIVSRGRI